MYNKLFAKIVRSSIWLEPTPTRLIWFMFIALMDEDGFVQFASVANVAHTARVSDEEAEEAIRILEAPDPNSADDEHEGRRIERAPGGWLVLNAAKYRDLVTRDMMRQRTRERVARHRSKLKKASRNGDVTPCNAEVTQSYTYTEVQSEKKRGRPLSLSDVVEYGKTISISASDAEGFFDSQEAGGWKRNGKSLADWKASLRTWKRNGWLPSQKSASQRSKPKEGRDPYDMMSDKLWQQKHGNS